MHKGAIYFSHDSNARNDEKIIAVRMRHGAEGYAIYFMIIERLLEGTNYMSVKDYNIIAFDLRVSAEKVKSVINDFNLFDFSEDGRLFYSNSLINRMRPLDNLREQRREAGLKSAEKRAKASKKVTKINECQTTVQRSLNEKATKESRVKKSKEEKSKEEEEKVELGDKSPAQKSFKNFSEQEFVADIARFKENFDSDILNNFFKYWKERSPSGKMRFQLEKTWETKLRLEKWKSNQLKFNSNVNKATVRQPGKTIEFDRL